MPTPAPIACSLTAAQMPERLAEIRAIASDALLSSEIPEPRKAVLRFRGSRESTARLEALIAAESQCCAFLEFELVSDGTDALLLKIAGPQGAEPVVRDLVSAFGGDAAVAAEGLG